MSIVLPVFLLSWHLKNGQPCGIKSADYSFDQHQLETVFLEIE